MHVYSCLSYFKIRVCNHLFSTMLLVRNTDKHYANWIAPCGHVWISGMTSWKLLREWGIQTPSRGKKMVYNVLLASPDTICLVHVSCQIKQKLTAIWSSAIWPTICSLRISASLTSTWHAFVMAESENLDSEAGDLSVAVPAKKCRYCGTWSNTHAPWPLLGTLLAGWHPYIPWSRGKNGRPLGDRWNYATLYLV